MITIQDLHQVLKGLGINVRYSCRGTPSEGLNIGPIKNPHMTVHIEDGKYVIWAYYDRRAREPRDEPENLISDDIMEVMGFIGRWAKFDIAEPMGDL